jgi:hypothetical protein
VIAAAVAERRVIRKGASGTLRYRDLVKLNFSNNPVAACDDMALSKRRCGDCLASTGCDSKD